MLTNYDEQFQVIFKLNETALVLLGAGGVFGVKKS